MPVPGRDHGMYVGDARRAYFSVLVWSPSGDFSAISANIIMYSFNPTQASNGSIIDSHVSPPRVRTVTEEECENFDKN